MTENQTKILNSRVDLLVDIVEMDVGPSRHSTNVIPSKLLLGEGNIPMVQGSATHRKVPLTHPSNVAKVES